MINYDVIARCSDGDNVTIKTQASCPIAALRAAMNVIMRDWEERAIPLVEQMEVRVAGKIPLRIARR